MDKQTENKIKGPGAVLVRFDDFADLSDWLAARAEKNLRSPFKEIIAILSAERSREAQKL